MTTQEKLLEKALMAARELAATSGMAIRIYTSTDGDVCLFCDPVRQRPPRDELQCNAVVWPNGLVS